MQMLRLSHHRRGIIALIGLQFRSLYCVLGVLAEEGDVLPLGVELLFDHVQEIPLWAPSLPGELLIQSALYLVGLTSRSIRCYLNFLGRSDVHLRVKLVHAFLYPISCGILYSASPDDLYVPGGHFHLVEVLARLGIQTILLLVHKYPLKLSCIIHDVKRRLWFSMAGHIWSC